MPSVPFNKALVCAIVAAAHIGVLETLVKPIPRALVNRPETFVSTGFVSVSDNSGGWDTSPLPDVQLATPSLETGSLVDVSFEDPEDNEAVMGSASSPRLSRVQTATTGLVAEKAGLILQQPQTVVLSLSILEDGQVGSVEVAKSSGKPDVDTAAAEYARMLHWIPGTKDHKPQAMKITFPVIFT